MTAIIASAYYPDYIWLASEGLALDDIEPYQAISERRNIVLYPSLSKDGSAFQKYTNLAKQLQQLSHGQVRVSRYLEDNANEDQRKAGLDIAYFLTHLREPRSLQAAANPGGLSLDSSPTISLNPNGTVFYSEPTLRKAANFASGHESTTEL
ncbi:hypothetical protein GCM10028810_32510 [Spirosoma litoris]